MNEDLNRFVSARIGEDEGVQGVLSTLPFDFKPERLEESTRRVMASHYADHPDYREEWKP